MIRSSGYVDIATTPSYAGFTLVELIVTLVLVGVVAAIGAPRFFVKSDFDQYGFFNETLSAVRYAQKLAVASGCVVRVNIAAASYTLYQSDPAVANASSPAVCAAATYNTAVYGTAVKKLTDANSNFTNTAPSGIGLSAVTDTAVAVTDFYFVPLGNLGSPSSPANLVNVTVGNKTFAVWVATGFVR